MQRSPAPAVLLVGLLAACTTRPAPAPRAGQAQDAGLPAFDVLAAAPLHPTRTVDGSFAAGRLDPGATLRVDERMGLPTFVWTRPSADPALRSAVQRLGPEGAARTHVAELAPLYALSPAAVAQAELASIHDIGRGGIIARFRQRVQGVPVFGASLSVLMDRQLQPLALSGHLSPDAEAAGRAVLRFDLDERDAIDRALTDLHGTGLPRQALGGARTDQAGARLHQVVAPPAGVAFVRPPRTRRVLYQLPDRLEPATYVELAVGTPRLADTAWYAYAFSAIDGRMLMRHDLAARDAFTYRAWADGASPWLPANGPQGNAGAPYPGAAPAKLALPLSAPILVTLQNAPFSRNDPWLPPGARVTTGNNVDAYADVSGSDGFDSSDFRADVTAPGVFDRTYDVTLAPAASQAQGKASVTQLFFVNNFLHDWYYDSGFDEAAGNAQQDNFGRGGAGGDPIDAEAQDSSGTDNANMATPSDGASPRMQMYVWIGQVKGQVQLLTPPAIAGTLADVGYALFGPSSFDLTGTLTLVDDGTTAPTLGCEALANGGAVAGTIALVDRGTCPFVTKVLNAQAAGAIAVLVANNVAGTLVMAGSDPTITIPTLLVTQGDGASIKAQLGTGVTARLSATKSLDRDGSIDNTIVAHEWGHHVSNRLIADANGLANPQGRSLGEGWSDAFALLLMVREGDTAVPGNETWGGTYALGSYAGADFSNDPYYYGVRRVPYSTDPTRDGLTFKHVTDGVALPVGPPTSFGQDGASNSEVHNSGEVWATMLWECYAALLRDAGRLTFAEAQLRMKDYLIASLKLTPPNPTFLEARDALLAAALAGDPADHRLFLQAFARRGAGTRAVAPDRYASDNAGAVESFSGGDDVALVSAGLDDSSIAPCGTTGVLSAGGAGLLTVTVRNVGPDTLTATTASVASTSPDLGFPAGAVLVFGPMAPRAVATATLPVTLAASAAGVQALALTITVDDQAMATPLTVDLVQRANYDDVAGQSAADDVEGQATAWTVDGDVALSPSTAWQRVERAPTDHRWQSQSLLAASDQYLVSPPMMLGVGPLEVTFTHRYDYDVVVPASGPPLHASGGVFEMSVNGGPWQDAGRVASPGYTQQLVGGGPLAGRRAFAGRSAGFPGRITSVVPLGTRYAGQSVRFRFRSSLFPTSLASTLGWEVDDIQVSGTVDLPFDRLVGRSGACAHAPTAVASAPGAVTAGTAGTLDGTGSSDPDGRALTYAWIQASGPLATITGASAARPTFTVPSAGQASFLLRVSNGLLWSAPARVTVTVNAPPAPHKGGGCASTGGGLDGSALPLGGLAAWLAWRRRRPYLRKSPIDGTPGSTSTARPLWSVSRWMQRASGQARA